MNSQKSAPKELNDMDSDDNQTPNVKNYGNYEDKSANMNFEKNLTPKSMKN